MYNNDIENLVGSETHLTPSILDKEIVPENYLTVRWDRSDGFGGVIIIYRDNITTEEIRFEKSEIIAVKVATFEKPIVICAC